MLTLCAATEANAALYSGGGEVKLEKHSALIYYHPKHIFLDPLCMGFKHLSWIFGQPAMTLAVLIFPYCAVPADNKTLYEMLKIVSEQSKQAQRQIAGITIMSYMLYSCSNRGDEHNSSVSVSSMEPFRVF